MSACPKCGRKNIPDAVFCQECGIKLADAAAPAATEKPPSCPKCHTINTPGMGFCKMCGTPLDTGAAPPPPVEVASDKMAAGPAAEVAAPAAPQKITCFSCGKPTPAGLGFCQNCGTKLAATMVTPAEQKPARGSKQSSVGTAPPAQAATPKSRPDAATIRAESRTMDATPPVEAPVAKPAPVAAPAPAPVPAPAPAPVAAAPAPAPAAPQAPLRDTRSSSTSSSSIRSIPRTDARASVRGRLVFMADGADGETHPILGDTFDVGRVDGNLVFGSDLMLAPRHARFAWNGGAMRIRSLDGTNGVYLRIREGHELSPGDQILIGHQLLRYEQLGPEERDPPQLVEHGVRLVGSPTKEAWGRLRQLTVAGTTRDIWHLTRPEMSVGRNEGDVVFPDDDLVSRHHAILRRVSGKSRLEEPASGGGAIFVRIRGERELRDGDQIRMGEQLVRFESLG